MYITRIEAGRGNRYHVFGNDEFLFSLYGRELKHYHIIEGTEVSDSVIDSVLEKVILKRAKERALYLLERRPLSVSMLRERLRSNDYPETIIEQVISILEEYHYLDDKEYIRIYVNFYTNKKSRRQIIYDLLRKGVSKDIIDEYFENSEYSELECFECQFKRYTSGKNLTDNKVRQKVFRYFYGKGFSVSFIEKSLREQEILSGR